jgi:hypothetical protein
LPDKALFATHAPSKVDQRKRALEQYLRLVISLPLKDVTDLCEFLSTNVIEQETEPTRVSRLYIFASPAHWLSKKEPAIFI